MPSFAHHCEPRERDDVLPAPDLPASDRSRSSTDCNPIRRATSKRNRGGADLVRHSHAPPANPHARGEDDQKFAPAPDRARGLGLEVEAIVAQIAGVQRQLDLCAANAAEVDAALAERRWAQLYTAASRLHALAGHLVRATARPSNRKAAA